MGGDGSCSHTFSRGMTEIPIATAVAFSLSLLSPENPLEELRAPPPQTTTKASPAISTIYICASDRDWGASSSAYNLSRDPGRAEEAHGGRECRCEISKKKQCMCECWVFSNGFWMLPLRKQQSMLTDMMTRLFRRNAKGVIKGFGREEVSYNCDTPARWKERLERGT